MDNIRKPFACCFADCEMSFTNEDHLDVHTKRHAMVLQLGLCGKAAMFEADQTPTPTRLIRNCDEVGLFDDLHLHHVNPFEETFRRAVETKSLDETITTQLLNQDELIKSSSIAEDSLHTPRVLPLIQSCPATERHKLVNVQLPGKGSKPNEAIPKAKAKPKISKQSTSHLRPMKVRRVLPKCNSVEILAKPTPHRIPSVSVAPVAIIKSVRQVLKEQILKGRQATTLGLTKSQSIVTTISGLMSDDIAPASAKQRLDNEVKDEDQQRFDRNKEAAKRYRSKMKQRNVETKLINLKLEEENRRLKNELSQLKAILQAHQHCPITTAMSLGHSIPIGPPKIMFTNSRSNSSTPAAKTLCASANSNVANQMYYVINANGMCKNKKPNS